MIDKPIFDLYEVDVLSFYKKGNGLRRKIKCRLTITFYGKQYRRTYHSKSRANEVITMISEQIKGKSVTTIYRYLDN